MRGDPEAAVPNEDASGARGEHADTADEVRHLARHRNIKGQFVIAARAFGRQHGVSGKE